LTEPKQAAGGATERRTGLPARQQAARIIELVVDDHRSLESLTSDPGGLPGFLALEPQDRALARAIATVTLRHRGRIEHVLGKFFDRPPPAKARHFLHALHAAAAQILFMNVPDSAAVDLAVTALTLDRRSARFAGLANAILRRLVREKEHLTLPQTAAATFPRWLSDRLRSDYGRENADRIAAAILREPSIDITPSTRLATAEIAALARDLDGIVLPTGSIRTVTASPVRNLPRFEEGVWWVQDAAAAIPAKLLGDVRSQRVADLCAAPGGKTMQLASAGALVTAVDQSASRLERLQENLKRVRLSAEIVNADILEWQPRDKFDAVLLDAPCSATGTIRRNPDVMWTKTPQDVSALSEIQRQLVNRVAEFVKPGGILVYANCSMLKEEGEDLVSGVRAEADLFAVDPVRPEEVGGLGHLINGQGALRTLPFHLDAAEGPLDRLGGMDGFFACRMRRRD
jgi:16S rRNA (cytosine967-C5)-methyltransferase